MDSSLQIVTSGGAVARNWRLYVKNDDGYFYIRDNTAIPATDRLTIDLNGNVGIGTAGPGAKLDVQGGDINTSGKLKEGGNALIPAGAVMSFNSSSCPSGWIAADGTSGTPDLRGAFIRGMNGNLNGRDVERTLGNYQDDEFESHTHMLAYAMIILGQSSSAAGSIGIKNHDESSETGGTETRPKNVALMYCVKQ